MPHPSLEDLIGFYQKPGPKLSLSPEEVDAIHDVALEKIYALTQGHSYSGLDQPALQRLANNLSYTYLHYRTGGDYDEATLQHDERALIKLIDNAPLARSTIGFIIRVTDNAIANRAPPKDDHNMTKPYANIKARNEGDPSRAPACHATPPRSRNR